MARFIRFFLLVVFVMSLADVLCGFSEEGNGGRGKRSLIFPPGPVGKVQAIMGAGVPVDLQDESVIVGIVIKAFYLLPRNASDFTNPNIFYARRKRETRSPDLGPSRWDVYKILEQYATSFGLGGKECLLRTICELSHAPIDKSRGILEEILHVLFQPTTTREIVDEHADNDYYAAQMLGLQAPGQCSTFYAGCSKSYADLFTV